ncbi:hypothetical protein M422DRAFT_38490, partial [Sphaerobolus stellatus SS14]
MSINVSIIEAQLQQPLINEKPKLLSRVLEEESLEDGPLFGYSMPFFCGTYVNLCAFLAATLCPGAVNDRYDTSTASQGFFYQPVMVYLFNTVVTFGLLIYRMSLSLALDVEDKHIQLNAVAQRQFSRIRDAYVLAMVLTTVAQISMYLPILPFAVYKEENIFVMLSYALWPALLILGDYLFYKGGRLFVFDPKQYVMPAILFIGACSIITKCLMMGLWLRAHSQM